MLIVPYYAVSVMLGIAGKTFNWTFFIFLVGLSGYMAYSFLVINSRKLWDQQIIRD